MWNVKMCGCLCMYFESKQNTKVEYAVYYHKYELIRLMF